MDNEALRVHAALFDEVAVGSVGIGLERFNAGGAAALAVAAVVHHQHVHRKTGQCFDVAARLHEVEPVAAEEQDGALRFGLREVPRVQLDAVARRREEHVLQRNARHLERVRVDAGLGLEDVLLIDLDGRARREATE